MKLDIYNDLLDIKDAKELYNKKINMITNDNIDLNRYIFNKLDNKHQTILLNHLSKYKYKNKIHLLLDIDDTIYPGGIGGTDVSYKKKHIYPFFSLLLTLFIEKTYTSSFVTIITARPRFLRKQVIKHFNKIFKNINFDVMSGKIKYLSEGIGDFIDKYFISYIKKIKIRNVNISEKSFNTSYKKILYINIIYIKIIHLYSKFEFIFIGDSGQGDIDTSILMMNNHNNVKYCFIHNIIRLKKKKIIQKYKKYNFIFNIYPQSIVKKLKKQKIFFFDTYLDVFNILYKNNYMDNTNKKKIHNEINEYMKISNKYFISDILYHKFIDSISKYK